MLFSEHGSPLVHHYRVFGQSAVNFGCLLSGPMPKPSGRQVVHQTLRLGCCRHQIHRFRYHAVFDPGDRMMTLRPARPVGRGPRLYRKCRLKLRHQRSSRRRRPMSGQLRPVILRCRSRARLFTAGCPLCC